MSFSSHDEISYIPLNRLVEAATKGLTDKKGRTASINFLEDEDGSGNFVSYHFHSAFKDAVLAALAEYGITPEVRTNKYDQVQLFISAEQYAAAAKQYIAEATGKLKELTGTDWTYEPEVYGFCSPIVKRAAAPDIRKKILEAGIQDADIHDHDSVSSKLETIASARGDVAGRDAAIVDIGLGYVDVWLAAQKQSERGSHAERALTDAEQRSRSAWANGF